jgi:hypothetical protein
MASGESERELSVRDAAALWGVSRNIVYYWIKTGLVTCFRRGRAGETTASREDVLNAPVLQRREVLARGISPRLLDRAVRERIAVPIQGRFSLRDLEAIAEWPGTPKDDSAAPHPAGVRRQSGFVRALQWNQRKEMEWVERGADPWELPPGYFDLPKPPRFIGPADLFRYTLGAPVPNKPGARYVRRSPGYERRDGKLVWCEQDDQFDKLPKNARLPQKWSDANREYDLLVERWIRVWWVRSGESAS